MSEHPDVSVIVATRNRAAYLSDALASLTRSRCDADFELVVVDNGSSDETSRVLEHWRRHDPRIRVVCEPQPGLSRAKNAGVAAARGHVLAFTDDDVVVENGWLDALLQTLAEHPCDLVIVGGKIVPIPDDLRPWPRWFDNTALVEAGLLDLPWERPVAAPQYVWGANMAARSDVFEQVGRWNEDLGRRGDDRGTFEDTEFQDRLRAADGAVWFSAGAVLKHRVPRSTLTRRELVLRALARGGYDARIELLHGRARHTPSLTIALMAAVWSALTMMTWAVVFRLVPTRRAFRRLHHAALQTGRHLDALERNEYSNSVAIGRAVRRGVWISRRLIKDRP